MSPVCYADLPVKPRPSRKSNLGAPKIGYFPLLKPAGRMPQHRLIKSMSGGPKKRQRISDRKKRMIYRSNATKHDHGVMVPITPTAGSKDGMGWILKLNVVLSFAVTHQPVDVQPANRGIRGLSRWIMG